MNEMEHQGGIVLLTGAGASGYFGLATLDELLGRTSIGFDDKEIMGLLLEVTRSIEAINPDRSIFEELISKLRYYLELTRTLKMDQTLIARIGVLPHSITTGTLENKWWKALTKCYRTLVGEYGPDNIAYDMDEVQTVVALLESIARLDSDRLHLFTTNYDCSYQKISANCDTLNFLSHIDSKKGLFSDIWFPSRKDLAEKSLPEIYVHRLHGCIAWFIDKEMPYQIKEIFGAGGKFQINDDGMLHDMCIKLVGSEEIGLNAAFLSAFQEFYDKLNTAKCLLVWGFSFRDREVLRAINGAFYTRKEAFPIYYIDPYLSEDEVFSNIRETLRPVPVHVSDHFRPKQIPWLPKYSGEQLIEATMTLLKEIV